MDGVSRIVTDVLDKAFAYDIAGLILTSYGRDHADDRGIRRCHER